MTGVQTCALPIYGETFEDASKHAFDLARESGLVVVHPFDDPQVIAGQGTLGLELVEEIGRPGTVYIPVGGGGLLAGIGAAVKEIYPETELVAVQAQGASSLLPSLKEGRPVACPEAHTIADGIAVKTIGKIPFPIHQALVDDVILLAEPEIEQAICLYMDIEKTVAEGAGATPLAALLGHPQRFAGKKVGLVLSGGNIDSRLLAQVINRGMVRSGRVMSLRIHINDVPGTLARVASVVGETGGNILEVHHQRMFTDVPAKAAELDLMVETRDPESARDMIKIGRAHV